MCQFLPTGEIVTIRLLCALLDCLVIFAHSHLIDYLPVSSCTCPTLVNTLHRWDYLHLHVQFWAYRTYLKYTIIQKKPLFVLFSASFKLS